MEKYDITIIGSGPGGYVSAIRCAQLGVKVAIIEKYNTLGGTCLNVGCIPSKALLDSSEHYHNAKDNFSSHGINISDIKVDLGKMIARKDSVVSQTCDGITYLMNKNKITVYTGVASFKDKNTIQISGEKETTIETKNTIIATGSKPSNLPFLQIDKKRIISSTEALNLKEIPKHLIVIGGGVIGLELGSVYKRLGSNVTVVEYANKITPGMDSDVSKELLRSLKKQDIKFALSHRVTGAEVSGSMVKVMAKNKKDEDVEFIGDYCLLSVGRRPYTKGLGLDNIGIELDERGFVKVTNNFETNIKGIYAIGDVIGGNMLAHKAEEEGVFVSELLAGEKPHINHNLIPGVIYTWPEAASVGKTEQELKDENVQYKVGKFPFKALGRARASADLDGMVKVLADKQTDEVLGVHMVGARVADIIAEAVVAMEFRASAEDISRICHAHPTFTEAVKEAALAATDNRPIHI